VQQWPLVAAAGGLSNGNEMKWSKLPKYRRCSSRFCQAISFLNDFFLEFPDRLLILFADIYHIHLVPIGFSEDSHHPPIFMVQTNNWPPFHPDLPASVQDVSQVPIQSDAFDLTTNGQQSGDAGFSVVHLQHLAQKVLIGALPDEILAHIFRLLLLPMRSALLSFHSRWCSALFLPIGAAWSGRRRGSGRRSL
jgi:hypothetical protein